MDEIIPYIILILVLLAFEMIHISCAESKIKKWILPILSFLFSLFILLNLIVFELGCQTEPKKIGLKEFFSATAWGNLPVLNIPTIIFITTNIIMEKLNNKKKKENNT